MATIAVGVIMTFVLAGCGDDEPAKPEVLNRSVSSSTRTKPSTSPKPAEKSATLTESETPTETSAITQVDGVDYTPANGPNTRLFQLEDGTTRCFFNGLSGDAYLACQVNLANPPMVGDGTGNKVPANAVSWNPGGVTYEAFTSPPAGEMKTLPVNSQLNAFGYSCAAYGPSTLECSGPAGAATIDNGNVTSAQMPEEDVPLAASGQPSGQENGAPNDPAQQGEPDGSPAPGNLPDLGALIPGLNH